jgi:LysR family transcriptional regulator, regulator of abg operon
MRELWRLQHFLGVAEAGSFHAAARQLNISQPALTKSIRILEKTFGTELFLRLPKGVRLTEAGELLHQRAREIEASWNAATIEVGAQSTGMGGFMRIGGGPVYSAVYFPNMLADMRRRFPNLKVSVSTGVGTELLPALKVGDIRAYAGGVPSTEVELGPDFETEILYQQSNAIYASHRHPLFSRDGFEAADTLSYPWLSLFSGQLANFRIQRYFSKIGLPPPSLALESHSVQVALKMISDHEFIACMPVPLAGAFPEIGLRELELEKFRWSIPTGVTYHRASAGFGPIVMMIRSLRSLTSTPMRDGPEPSG